MRKRLVFSLLLIGNHSLHNQLPIHHDTGWVKLDDVVEEYFEHQGPREEHEEGAEHLDSISAK